MKIDLHVHTIKTSLDNTNRNIPNIHEFLNILNNSNVGIVAITNHNLFDNNQYEEILVNNKNNILFLPGIELSVRIEDKIKHLNLIFDPNSKNELIQFIREHKIDNHEFKSIEIEKVLEKFGNSNKCIFYLDFKNERKFFESDINKYFKNSDFNSVYLFDVNNEKSFDFFLYWNENCLIGSDNKDWISYEKESKKLVEYNSLIRNFNDLYQIFKNKTTYDFFRQHNLIENFNEQEIVLLNEKQEKKISEIPNLKIIKSSVNVIFGPKASGKSSLLKSLYNNLNIDESKKSLFEIIEDLNEENTISIISKEIKDIFVVAKNEFNDKLNQILKYSEIIKNRTTMKDFYYSIKNKVIGKNNIVNLNNVPINKPEINYNIKEIIKKFKEIITKYNEINENNNFNPDIKQIKSLNENLKNKYIDRNMDYWKFKFRDEILQSIKNILKTHKQQYSKVWTFGLKEKYHKRKNLLFKIKQINNIFNKSNTSQIVSSLNVPIENSEKIRTWNVIASLKLGWKKGEKNFFNNNSSSFRNNLEKLLKTNDLKSSINIIEELNRQKTDDIFKIIFSFKCDEDEERKPSSGELSFIRLMNELEKKNVEYFFLDEPESHLNNNFISTFILSKMIELVKNKKTLIVSTLNSVIGINTHPINYILRETINIKYNDLICNQTWIGNISEGYLTSCYNQEQKLNINEKILEYFEGKKELYKYRKKVYGVD